MAVERALEEQRLGHPDGMKESDQFPPVFNNTDWTHSRVAADRRASVRWRDQARRARSGPGPRGCCPRRRTRPRSAIDHVVDGDTVALRNGPRVRLVQIDTPEVYYGAECYGRRASAITKRLLRAGTRVRLLREPATDASTSTGGCCATCPRPRRARRQPPPRRRGRGGTVLLPPPARPLCARSSSSWPSAPARESSASGAAAPGHRTTRTAAWRPAGRAEPRVTNSRPV